MRRAELTFWAFILALAYLPLPFGFVAWFALARPLAIISRLDGRTAFKAAYFYSFMSNLFQLYWVAYVTPPGMLAAVFILSLYPSIILTTFAALYRRRKSLGLAALPFLWVGMEFFRSLTEFAFPWTDLAYSQGYYLTFIQIVSVTGAYGLSFALMLMNIAVWQVVERSNRMEARINWAIAFIAIPVFLYVYGWVVFPPVPEIGKFRVSLLQGNVDLNLKWNPETRDSNFVLYDSLVQVAGRDSADLIVWPETAAPAYPRHEPVYFHKLAASAVKSKAYNLVGALDIEYDMTGERTYNSAFQISPDGNLDGVYHKIRLVPFSEHSPYQRQLPFLTRDFLGKYLDAIKTHEVQWWSDFYPGDSIVIFDAGGAEYAVLICFESAFPDLVRRCILKGAGFIVNITNDTWFGYSPGPFQHLRMAVFRAVENRTWITRCANSGISAVIDPYGREVVRAGLYTRRVITADINSIEDLSVFTRIGPLFGQISLLITVAVLFVRLLLWIVRRLL
jgi:apolipoprotein N-acyltransferase